MSDIQANIVIDNGSSSIKCGFSGEEAPKSIFPNVINVESQKIGDESLINEHPIEKGFIKNFEQMEKIWEYTFKEELRVSSDERNVLLSDNPLAPKISREKMTQIMFEKFNIQGLFVCIRPMLCMYCVGKTSALVLESGEDVSQTVPIIEGYYFPYSITKTNLAGKTITDVLTQKISENLNKNGQKSDFNSYENRKIVREIKEKMCRVSLDYDTEILENNIPETRNKLPDGNEISIKSEVFTCPEVLFKPELYNIATPGLHLQMLNSIMKCELDQRKELYSNIIVSGGNTLLNDFPERITMEMQGICSNNIPSKVKVNAQSERKYTAWIGGALIAGLPNFQANWVTHSEYQEAGPQIIHRKCF